ncbi:MAG: wax ester/triacylglycerol synthase domain-containing protein [Pseudomonadota bacterium]
MAETSLPRDRPLWTATIVDGLADQRWAVVVKMHHALADGGAGHGRGGMCRPAGAPWHGGVPAGTGAPCQPPASARRRHRGAATPARARHGGAMRRLTVSPSAPGRRHAVPAGRSRHGHARRCRHGRPPSGRG